MSYPDYQLERAVAYCGMCDGELYESDTAWYDNSTDQFICCTCLEAWAKENLEEYQMDEVKKKFMD